MKIMPIFQLQNHDAYTKYGHPRVVSSILYRSPIKAAIWKRYLSSDYYFYVPYFELV